MLLVNEREKRLLVVFRDIGKNVFLGQNMSLPP